jgi:hypothetical protein
VLPRYKGLNVGEIEMRNTLFYMLKLRAMKLLFEKIPQIKKFSDKVFVYSVCG